MLRVSTWHRFCLAHPLRRPLPELQCLTIFRSFSTSFEEKLRPDSPRVVSSSQSSSGTARIPQEEKAKNGAKTRTTHSRRPSEGTRTRTRTHTRTRPRTLRPLLIPPTFPHNIIFETPSSDPQRSSHPQKDTGEIDSSVTITVANLPPNTFKLDVRPVFQQFGEIQRVVMGPGGTSADIIFMDAQGAKRTLRAYAEEPFFLRGQEIAMFRKCTSSSGSGAVNGYKANVTTGASQARNDWGDGSGVIFVAAFPSGTTQNELSEAFSRFGRHEKCVMRPGSKYAYFVYSSDDRVEQILCSHKRIPVTLHGIKLRIERTVNRPYYESSDLSLELGTQLDPAASEAIIEELKRTVPRWRGSYEPSRVLWIGRLPTNISQEALTNFWSRLGCVVEVRASTSGFAHIEFSSTEEALRAARKGAPHGFRYADRLLDVDFAPWLFHIGPLYRVVHISGWCASRTHTKLRHWASDIPHIIGGAVLPSFRGEERTDPRAAFLQFRSIDDARAGLNRLEGRRGPHGEALRVSLSRFPALPLKDLWHCVDMEEEMQKRGEEPHLEREWEGLGFGTGAEDSGPDVNVSPVGTRGTRGGRVRLQNGTRAGVAATGLFVDGPLGGGEFDDEVLEEAMRTAMEDAGRAVHGTR